MNKEEGAEGTDVDPIVNEEAAAEDIPAEPVMTKVEN